MITSIPLAVSLASHMGEINIWRINQSACNGEGCRTQPLALMIHCDSSHFFSLNLSQLSQILGFDLWTQVHYLPRLLAFLIKETFLSTDSCLLDYWLPSAEQPNWSLMTCPQCPLLPSLTRRSQQPNDSESSVLRTSLCHYYWIQACPLSRLHKSRFWLSVPGCDLCFGPCGFAVFLKFPGDLGHAPEVPTS